MAFLSLINFQSHDGTIYEFDSESIRHVNIDKKTLQEIQQKFHLEQTHILEEIGGKEEVQYFLIKEEDISEFNDFFKKE